MTNYDHKEFTKNLTKIAEQSQLIIQEFLSKKQSDGPIPVSTPLHLSASFVEMFGQMLLQPEKFMQFQIEYYRDYLTLIANVSEKFLGDDKGDIYSPKPKDRRFQDQAWNENIIFDYIKQSYVLTSNWMKRIVRETDGLDQKTMQKLEFYTKQFIDAMAPSNFIMTNPEVLRVTLETNGKNLVDGLKNMLADLEKSNGQFDVRRTDLSAFKIGKNLATSPGKVIYQNDLMQLIQYSPVTEKVYKTPLLLIPAWINKFYIFDMKKENSFVKWLVEKGFTVFLISWVNPGRELAGKTFEDYMQEGPLAAFKAIEKATGEKETNVISYCLGGTLMAATLGYLAKKNMKKVKSVAYLTTLVDFSDAGDLSVFVDEGQIKEIEGKMALTGYFDGADMANIFNMLRSNDLIWSFVINNYLLGREPFPFDLLYWNSDTTRMPAKMHSYYLRNMYLNNMMIRRGGLKLCGVDIDLSAIKIPSYILSAREDHIAPWGSTFQATKIYKGPVRFVLSASGHVAGVINHPDKKKYSYWTADDKILKRKTMSPQQWLEAMKEHPGSWWMDWLEWIKKYSGEKVAKRPPGKGKLKAIEDAPGSYVMMKG